MKALFLVFLCAACACSVIKADTNLQPDLHSDVNCVAVQVLAGNLSPISVEAACLPGQLTTVVDLLEALVTSDFGAKHPEVVAPVLGNVAAARAAGTVGK